MFSSAIVPPARDGLERDGRRVRALAVGTHRRHANPVAPRGELVRRGAEARHDDAAVGVHDLGVRVLLCQRGGVTDLGDLLAIDGDCPVLEVGVVSVARDDATVGDEQAADRCPRS